MNEDEQRYRDMDKKLARALRLHYRASCQSRLRLKPNEKITHEEEKVGPDHQVYQLDQETEEHLKSLMPDVVKDF